MVKVIVPIFVSVLLGGTCGGSIKTVRSPALKQGSIHRIAVAAFSGPNKETGAAIADSLIPDLIEMGFVVVERSRLEALIQEQQLQQTGLTDPQTTVKIGEMLNVDTILVGDYSAHQETAFGATDYLFQMGRGGGRGLRMRGPRFRARRRVYFGRRFGRAMSVAEQHNILEFESLSVRLVSVASGEILLSAARRTPFPSDELGDVLEDFHASLQKSLEK